MICLFCLFLLLFCSVLLFQIMDCDVFTYIVRVCFPSEKKTVDMEQPLTSICFIATPLAATEVGEIYCKEKTLTAQSEART